jgi:hypothetical protein
VNVDTCAFVESVGEGVEIEDCDLEECAEWRVRGVHEEGPVGAVVGVVAWAGD